MSGFSSKDLILEAKSSLASHPESPRKLALIHTGIAAGASVLVALLTYVLDSGIGNTAGLSGLGSRAILATAQSVLQLLVSILSPFWAMGFVAAGLHWARRQDADMRTLTKGLRRWGPALRMLLLQGLLYFLVAMAAMQIGSILYTLTPASSRLDALVEEYLANSNVSDYDAVGEMLSSMDGEALLEILPGMLPFLLIPAALLLIPLSYRLRLAQYILMDEPRCGAMLALMLSFRLTKGNCLNLFKLDLRYWWYYVLEVLVVMLSFGDILLPLLGVPLNMGTVTASVLFYVLTLSGQLALYAWKKPQVFTTYALFYDRLLPKEQEQF